MYSKGDTIEFMDGSIAIVLNGGTPGLEFVRRHIGQSLNIMFSFSLSPSLISIHSGLTYRRNSNDWSVKQHIWYNVLMGDENLWIAWASLYFKVTGQRLPWRTEWDNDAIQ